MGTFLIRIQWIGWDRDERGSWCKAAYRPAGRVDFPVHRPHGKRFSARRDEESRELLTVGVCMNEAKKQRDNRACKAEARWAEWLDCPLASPSSALTTLR